MSEERVERRLMAILAADVVGYSRLMGTDEEGTLAALKAIRRELVDPRILEHRGRIVKTTGDGLLVEFASVIDALRCAGEMQTAMAERTAGVPPAQRIEYRVGIHQGDVVIEDGDIFGDGVNVAARLEGIAEPGGICVSARVWQDSHGKLDLEFEDIGDQSLKNIARAGRVYRVGQRASRPQAGEPPAVQPAPLALPDKPSIVVLPFQNMSGDPDQEYFADGMVEEIITALSRIRWLFVIARNSSFSYKGQPPGVRQVGHELGVRYVLEGSVRKSGDRVRITAQLIDAATGAHLWADSFDGSLEDVFELQDRIAASVAGVIEPALRTAETDRSAGRPTADLTAYDLYLRAYAMVRSSARLIPDALRLLDQAIERDPRYGPALACAAYCRFRMIIDDRSDDREADRSRAMSLARRALEVAADDPGTVADAVVALGYFGGDIGAMMGLIDRALARTPSFARGWHVSAILRLRAGHPDIAIEHFETSMRLSPRVSIGSSLCNLGEAYFLSRRFDEAIPKLLLAIYEDPAITHSYRVLAACYAQMGRLEKAREVVAQLRTMSSAVIHDTGYLRNAEHRELFLSGLRLAMGEAT